LQGLLTTAGLFNDEVMVREALRNRLPERGLIIDDQQMLLALSHLLRVGGILTPAPGPVNSTIPAAL